MLSSFYNSLTFSFAHLKVSLEVLPEYLSNLGRTTFAIDFLIHLVVKSVSRYFVTQY